MDKTPHTNDRRLHAKPHSVYTCAQDRHQILRLLDSTVNHLEEGGGGPFGAFAPLALPIGIYKSQ